MRFYDRDSELLRLSEIASLSARTSHILVITGRRRVGKTEIVKQFSQGRNDLLYFFVSRKKPHVLLEEFRDLLASKIPLAGAVSFKSFDDFFLFLFNLMKQNSSIIVFDEFQNFEFVDPSVFSVIQKHWDTQHDAIRGAFVFVGSVITIMKKIFEGSVEPLFGRATSKLYIEPLDPDAIMEIMSDYHLGAESHLLFYFTLFGGVPRYYFLADRYDLFGKSHAEVVRKLYCEPDAPLQNEGRELLIEEMGKNYYLYFSILQVIAGGETQMARIADGCGIKVSSISKYLDELCSLYQVIERKTPFGEDDRSTKQGRYYIKDQALRFWFRYIFKNQSLIQIGDEAGLAAKIMGDLPVFMGKSFEELVIRLLLKRNLEGALPFRFSRIGSFWSKKGEIEIDIVAADDRMERILLGECKLNGGRFTPGEARRLKEKASYIKGRAGKRLEYHALFSLQGIPESLRRTLEKMGVVCYSLQDLTKNCISETEQYGE